jgi:hypothetical protein
MLDKLMTQDDLEAVCPVMTKEIDNFITSHPLFNDSSEAVLYALTQLLHNRLQVLDMEPEEKGAIVAALIDGLIEFNKEPLALHNELIRAIREQKAGTVH